MIYIYKCGTKVYIPALELYGYITAIEIQFNNVTYQVSYFWNGEYKQVWLFEYQFHEVDAEKDNLQPVGFKREYK